MGMKLEEVNQRLQRVGRFFDRAFKSLTFSNLISFLAGTLLMLGLLGTGGVSVVAIIGGFLLFLSSGLFLADKEDVFFLSDLKEELRADLRKLKQEIQNEQKKAASSYPPPRAPREETRREFHQKTRPVQILPGHLPTTPRRRTSSRMTIIEEDNRKTTVQEKPISPSTPPRPRRKTGA